MPSELLTERRGTTLVLTISDPATRNTLSAQVIAAGIEALGVAEADPEVRCVVLQGAGGHFCAGGNVQGLVERRAPAKRRSGACSTICITGSRRWPATRSRSSPRSKARPPAPASRSRWPAT